MPEIACPLAVQAGLQPDAFAVEGTSERITYGELNVLVSVIARNLRDAGLRRGDIAAVVMAPDIVCPVLVLGIIRLGAVAFPINPRMPAEGLHSVLDSVGCRTIIASGNPALIDPARGLRVLSPTEVVRPGSKAAAPHTERVTTDWPAVIVLTSGSSAEPKAAVLTYGNLHANAVASNANLPLGPSDCWLLSLPLYHVSGLGVVFRCLIGGATVVVPDAEEDLVVSVRRGRITHVSLVTTQLIRLLRDANGESVLASLKAILLGGSALPAGLLHEALDGGTPVYISYGLTEMASQVATSRLTVGPVSERPSARVLIRGSVRINADSEIELQGPTLFAGYLRGESLNRPLTKDGWFATGDLGRLDPAGNLVVLGRRDNMFISGGENIQPEEIEAKLCRIGGVRQAVVVPIKDPEYGHRPAAFVETEAGAALDPEVLKRELAKHLPRYKIPVLFLPWPADVAAQGIKAGRRRLIEEAANIPRC